MAPRTAQKMPFHDAQELMVALGSHIATAHRKHPHAPVGVESDGFHEHGVAELRRVSGSNGRSVYRVSLHDEDDA